MTTVIVVHTLLEAVQDGPIVLDGGLATQLEAQGHDLSSDLWSARLLRDDPGAIVEAHRAFFRAGARVAITASYQASFDGLATLGLDQPAATALMARSIELGREAAALDAAELRWVAASVGPYGAVLADGSEYHGDYGRTVDELRSWHRPRLDALVAAGPDLLAVETVPCLAEAEALLRELEGSGTAAWLTLSCADGLTRRGEPVDEAFAMAAEVDEVIAVGVNCTDPTDVTDLVTTAARISGKPVAVYPNSGEAWDAVRRTWVGEPTFAPGLVSSWVEAGAGLVGGCCRVLPTQIRQVRDEIEGAPA